MNIQDAKESFYVNGWCSVCEEIGATTGVTIEHVNRDIERAKEKDTF